MAFAPSPHPPPIEDSGRWLDFPFRPGDIVISTRRKSGTTWMQMICALLIFQTPDLPEPLWRLSPWLESPAAPRDLVFAQLAGQRHRRFVKTHTPLNEIPSDPRVTYIVTARHPLDAFVSLYHQDLMIGPPPGPPPPRPPGPPPPQMVRAGLHQAMVEWITGDDDSTAYVESLPAAMRHLSAAWTRRGEPNVLLVHYDDLLADLEGQLRQLAAQLGITSPEQSWPALTEAATFARMRHRTDILVPPPPGVVANPDFFFRRGTSGAAHELLTAKELSTYYTRTTHLAPPDLLNWLHRQPARR